VRSIVLMSFTLVALDVNLQPRFLLAHDSLTVLPAGTSRAASLETSV
jgi:hypothetical protein